MKFLVAELLFHDNGWKAIGLYDSLLDAKEAVFNFCKKEDKGEMSTHTFEVRDKECYDRLSYIKDKPAWREDDLTTKVYDNIIW
ncbi:MAG: hypothetical protein HUJ68_13895 [Clostridia bacterium]|nr:hypothetical protein [Clostridia bacterium]